MIINFNNKSNESKLCYITEHSIYNKKLHHINKFPIVNKYKIGLIFSIILSFNFRGIAFNKKKALPFFLAIELISNQKCVASLSGRDVQV